jgi:hypothetical protein
MAQMMRNVESCCKAHKVGGLRLKALKDIPSLASEDKDWIARAADLTALYRSPVQRDSWHNIIAFPAPEIGTDLAQSLSRIAKGFNILGIERWRPYIWRICWDYIPEVRARVLREMVVGLKTESEIAEEIGLSPPTVKRHLEDIKLLGINVENIRRIGGESKG